MNSIIDISIDGYESNIKFNRKWLKIQSGLVLLNISLLCFDWYSFKTSTSQLTCVAFGAMIVTCLWSILFFLESWGELRDAKHKLRFLNELKDTRYASNERKDYINAKEHYEQLSKSLKEKSKND